MNAIDREIEKLQKEIEIDEQNEKLIDDFLNSLPKDLINKDNNNNDDIKKKLSQISTSTSSIEEILSSINALLLTSSSEDTLLLLKDILYKDKIKTKIENSLVNIRFPIFDGMMTINAIDKIKSTHEKDLNIIITYFKILKSMSFLRKDRSNLTGKITKEDFDDEIISDFLYKKIISSLISLDTFTLNDIDVIFNYITKALSNISEMLLALQIEIDSPAKLSIISYISNNILSRLSLFLLSSPKGDLSSLDMISLTKLLQASNDFNEDTLMKNYKYDILKNSSLNDWIKFSLDKEIVVIIEKNQKSYVEHMIEQIKSKIKTQIDKKTFIDDDIIDTIKLLIKDIVDIYTIFRSFTVIDNVLLYAISKIISLFTSLSRTNDLNTKVYIFNISFSYRLFHNKFFPNFENRLSLYPSDLIEKFSSLLIKTTNDIEVVIDDFSRSISKLINLSDMIMLFAVNNISTGNTNNKINSVFNIANDQLKLLSKAFSITSSQSQSIEYIVEALFGWLSHGLNKNIDAVIKSNVACADIELLVNKMKEFIDDVLNEGVNGQIRKSVNDIYNMLDRLIMITNESNTN